MAGNEADISDQLKEALESYFDTQGIAIHDFHEKVDDTIIRSPWKSACFDSLCTEIGRECGGSTVGEDEDGYYINASQLDSAEHIATINSLVISHESYDSLREALDAIIHAEKLRSVERVFHPFSDGVPGYMLAFLDEYKEDFDRLKTMLDNKLPDAMKQYIRYGEKTREQRQADGDLCSDVMKYEVVFNFREMVKSSNLEKIQGMGRSSRQMD